MDALSKALFVVIATALLAQGVRNTLWSESREQDRFRALVRRGLAAHMATSGFSIALFGGLLAYASRSVPFSLAWQTLGLAIVVLGCITVLHDTQLMNWAGTHEI
jgi:di/tricarboxylate transporter